MWFSRSSTHSISNSNKFNDKSSNRKKNISSPGGASITSTASSVTRLNDAIDIGDQVDDDDDDVTVDLFAPVAKAAVSTSQRAGAKDVEGSSGLRYFTQDLRESCSSDPSSTQGDTIPSPASQTLNVLDAFNNHSTDSTLYLSQTTRLATSALDVRGEKRAQGKGAESSTTAEELDLTVHCFCRNTANNTSVGTERSVPGKKHHSLCKHHPKYDSYLLDLTRSGAVKGCPSCRQLLRHDISHTPHLPTCRRNNDFKKKEQILTKKAKEAFTEITPAIGTSKTNEALSSAAGSLKSTNTDLGSNKNTPELDTDNVNHATLSSFFKHSHHIKAGVSVGCQRCIELSTKGTSNLRHGITCPSSRKKEGVTCPQSLPQITPLIKEIETTESNNETDISEKYASNWQQRLSDSTEEITCGPSQNSSSNPYQQPKLGFLNSYQSQTFTTGKPWENDMPMSKRQEVLRNDNHTSFPSETYTQETYFSNQEQRCEKLQLDLRPRIPAPIPRDSICTHSRNGGSRWMACGNPWGPFGYLEGDIVAVFGVPTSTPLPIDGILPSRYVQEPFTISSYIQTHSGGLGKYTVLFLRRDAFALQSWGFVTCLHEFGGACLVKEVTPCSPADAAVDVGNSQMDTEHPLGGGLRVNDMILCINGKVVGGMSEVDFLTELDLCGPTMILVIARCFDSSLNRSSLQSITENEASHWAFNEPLHWTEFGSSGSMHHKDRLSAAPSYIHWERDESFTDPNYHNDFGWNSSCQPSKLRHKTFCHSSRKAADSIEKGKEAQITDEAVLQTSQIHDTVEADDNCCIQTTDFGGKTTSGIASKRSYEQAMMSQKRSITEVHVKRPSATPTESAELIPISLRSNNVLKEGKSTEKYPAPKNCDTTCNLSQRPSFTMIHNDYAPVSTAARDHKSECSSKPVMSSTFKDDERTAFNNYRKDNKMQQISNTAHRRQSIENSLKEVNRVAESPELHVEKNYDSGEDKSTGSIGVSIQPPVDMITDADEQAATTNTQKLDLLVQIAEKATKEINHNPAYKSKQNKLSHQCQIIKGTKEDESVNISLYEGEEPWLSCICGKTHPSPIKVFWIQCDGCSSWYNVSQKCCGFDQDQAKILEKWHCPACLKRMSGDKAALRDCSRSVNTIAPASKQRQNQVKKTEKNKGRKRLFSVNELVVVTYNLTGDVGKVVQVHIDYNENKEKMISYDIRYLLGRGTERYVDEEWVTPFDNSAYACDGTRKSRGTMKKRIPVDPE